MPDILVSLTIALAGTRNVEPRSGGGADKLNQRNRVRERDPLGCAVCQPNGRAGDRHVSYASRRVLARHLCQEQVGPALGGERVRHPVNPRSKWSAELNMPPSVAALGCFSGADPGEGTRAIVDDPRSACVDAEGARHDIPDRGELCLVAHGPSRGSDLGEEAGGGTVWRGAAQCPDRCAAGRVRGRILRCPAGRPVTGWNPIATASIEPRVVHSCGECRWAGAITTRCLPWSTCW